MNFHTLLSFCKISIFPENKKEVFIITKKLWKIIKTEFKNCFLIFYFILNVQDVIFEFENNANGEKKISNSDLVRFKGMTRQKKIVQ